MRPKKNFSSQIWGQANFLDQAKTWALAKIEATIEARPTLGPDGANGASPGFIVCRSMVISHNSWNGEWFPISLVLLKGYNSFAQGD